MTIRDFTKCCLNTALQDFVTIYPNEKEFTDCSIWWETVSIESIPEAVLDMELAFFQYSKMFNRWYLILDMESWQFPLFLRKHKLGRF